MPASPRDAAAQVAAEVPDRDGRWAWPVDGLLRHLTAAGWPTEVYAITVTLPASTDAGGWHRPERRQDVEAKCVPRTWLLRLAAITGWRWPQVCRGEIDG